MRIDIFGDNISYVTDEVSTVKVEESNLNEENRAKFVTDLAAVSRGKDAANNPANRFASLLEEAAPTHENIESHKVSNTPISKSPSRPVEFLPVVIKYLITGDVVELFDTKGNQLSYGDDMICFSFAQFNNLIGKHSYLTNDTIYTNMRCLVNATIPYEAIPYNTPEELKDFKAIKANIPMFIWAQVPNTHTAISKEAQSDRVAENTGYWLPEDLRERVYEYWMKNDYSNKEDSVKESLRKKGDVLSSYGSYSSLVFAKLTIEILAAKDKAQIPYLFINGRPETLLSPTQYDVQMYFRELGYHREIWSRAMYYFKYKEVVMTAWYNDPKTWKHLFIERSVEPEINKNWTQKDTQLFCSKIKEIIGQ